MDRLIELNSKKKANSLAKLAKFLSNYNENFSLKLKWHLKVPFLSSFTPKDTCTLLKYKNKLRFDFSFVDLIGVKTIRQEMSSCFNGDTLEYERLFWERGEKINMLEEPTNLERSVLMFDLMLGVKRDSEFSLTDLTIKQSKSFFGNYQFEKIEGFSCQKYIIEFKIGLDKAKKQRKQYQNIEYDSLFGDKQLLISDAEQESVEKLTKKVKANIWVAKDYPLNTKVPF